MSSSVIGALRVVLGADTAAFSDGMNKAQRDLNRFGKDMARTGAKLTSAGQALTLGVTVPIIGIGVASMRAAQESADALAQVQASLTSMGGVSGKALADLEAQAESLMNASLFDDDDILRSVTANLLTFGKVSGQTFDRAQVAVVDLATKMRMDLQSATILVGKALNDPIKGLTALGRSGVQFTASQKELIKSLVATGQTAKAQSLILAELEKQFGGSAKAAQDANPYNKMQDSLNTLSETIGKKLIPTFQPLVDKLNAVLVKFTELSPAVQNNILLWGAVAAAIGPALIGLGALASSIRVVIPLVLAASAAVRTALAASLAFLMTPVGLVTAAIAALAVGLVVFAVNSAKAKEATAAVKKTTDAAKTSADLYAAAVAALTGKTKEEIAAAKQAIVVKRQAAERDLAAARASLVLARAKAQEAEAQLAANRAALNDPTNQDYKTRGAISQVGNDLADRSEQASANLKELGSSIAATEAKIRDATAALNQLGAVSNIPDLSGDIEEAGKKTRKAKEETREWADELANLREQLGTPIQRDIKTTADQIALLTEGLEKGKYTALEVVQALRMIDEALERDKFPDTIVKVDQNPAMNDNDLPETGTFGGKVMSKETAEGLKAEMTDTFRGALDALRYGGAKGVFEFLADSFANRLLDRLATQLTDLFDQIMGQMSGGTGGAGGGFGGVLSSVFSVFGGGSGGSTGSVGSTSSIPGFATGGSFTVGGSGGTDSKLMQIRATPGEHVNITHGDPMAKLDATLAHLTNSFKAVASAMSSPVIRIPPMPTAHRDLTGGINMGALRSPMGGDFSKVGERGDRPVRIIVEANDDKFRAYVADVAGPIAATGDSQVVGASMADRQRAAIKQQYRARR